jgi:hypothetical protein
VSLEAREREKPEATIVAPFAVARKVIPWSLGVPERDRSRQEDTLGTQVVGVEADEGVVVVAPARVTIEVPAFARRAGRLYLNLAAPAARIDVTIGASEVEARAALRAPDEVLAPPATDGPDVTALLRANRPAGDQARAGVLVVLAQPSKQVGPRPSDPSN